ncbi:hypothetical protein B0T10DRAFT_493467 [Thelonectria olida]|uniref:Zn(2)-C6 fungal-type domain-containing protein n=1 Tax=Thelonectria olida TaxID=1576542 RepID=A0A9P8VZD2_9HYPO|nr:hypothetical protein B0T10DRAFT_493467 [Thelonectria olida]
MPREQRRSNVRRANVTACSRCRSRKQRCDQNIPACSNCERAGVECVSTDIDGRVAPRSYMRSLEDRIAYLEAQLSAHGIEDGDMLSPNFSPSSERDLGPSSTLSQETDRDSRENARLALALRPIARLG